jgi:hypothetical protein
MSNNFSVLGLSGKAGSGKDYIFEHFLRPVGYHRWALADHFKIWIVGKGEATHEEVFLTKPPEIRKLLQEEGTERGRNVYGESVWVNTAFAWFRLLNETWGINKFLISDIRFPNEVEAVQNAGGKVFRIHAPGRVVKNKLTPEQRLHISETALNDYTKFDDFIYNDFEFAETVSMQLQKLLPEENIVSQDTGEYEIEPTGFFDQIKTWWNDYNV